MKKIILIVIFILTILLTSCKNDLIYLDNDRNTSEDKTKTNFKYVDSDDVPIIDDFLSQSRDFQYHEGYLYFWGHTFLRYNIKNGNITTVCQDALCNHSTPLCPFFGSIGNLFVDNANIHFTRNYHDISNGNPIMNREFGTYNLESMKYVVRNKIMGSNTFSEYNRQLFTDNYRYFYDFIYDEEEQRHFFQIARMDLNTNKITALAPKEEIINTDTFNIRFLFVLENRIYLTDINSIYSTDLDLNDKKLIMNGNFIYDDIFTDGTHIFYGVPTDTQYVISIHRANLDGTDNIELGIITNVSEWTITKNHIYYAVPFRKTIGSNGGVSFFSNAIIRCDYEGNDKKVVYQAANNEEDGTYIQLHGSTFVGNYIYTNYYTFDEKNEIYYSNLGEGYFLRINMIDNNIERIIFD